MTRAYSKAKRAEAQEETRKRIVRATMELHLEQGVATTSYLDVAARAGVGAATVYRHFPTMGSLVEACGAHIWQTIKPPLPEHAEALFAGQRTRSARLRRLVSELDDFYTRAAAPIWSAIRDRDRVPELALFIQDVRAGVTALVAEALGEDCEVPAVRIAAAVADFLTWLSVRDTGVDREERTRLLTAMIEAAVKPHSAGATRPGGISGSVAQP
jgi:AcrR family transcriptional regulator